MTLLRTHFCKKSIPAAAIFFRLLVTAAQPDPGMPSPADYTHMWWAEGFPSHTPTAPWLRVIQTGHYAMAVNTETLAIPHFGMLSAGRGYSEAVRDDGSWRNLPPARLDLAIRRDGITYHCRQGTAWTPHTGPMLVESGRWMQRALITDLTFTSDTGETLQVDASLETAAWPSTLALILTAKPKPQPIAAGTASFGRLGGGLGLTGSNHLEVPHSPDLEPEALTLELWAYVPGEGPLSFMPWLVCKSGNEWENGNYGIAMDGDHPRAVVNIGGGPENHFYAASHVTVQPGEWNHLAMTYDGNVLRMYVNGQQGAETEINRPRQPGGGPLAFGRRQDNSGDGYYFRGVLDEIFLYDHALDAEQIRRRAAAPETALEEAQPVAQWTFDPEGQKALKRPPAVWDDAEMHISLTGAAGTFREEWRLPAGQQWRSDTRREVALHVIADPAEPPEKPVRIEAEEVPNQRRLPVSFDPLRNWHRVDLDGVQVLEPDDPDEIGNNAIERIRLRLTNPAPVAQPARLLFGKTGSGFTTRIGSPITGMSAMLRDPGGYPTGIPVQISKNWHNRPSTGIYNGTWFHGFTVVTLPPNSSRELELTLAYAHWGGVAAASHAQLSLIGWGSNQLWDQAALGSWGESICFEPDMAQGACAILDVRPLMVSSLDAGQPWSWTHNVGGGDFFRVFDAEGTRLFPGGMKTAYLRQCPVLTEVTYAGTTGGAIRHQATVSLGRSDDITRGIYRLRLDVLEAMDFSRFVLFQIGADTYSYTRERRMALGNEEGLIREWDARWGGEMNQTAPMPCTGRIPWISLHQAVPGTEADLRGGAWANRGVIIRDWDARLGGRPAEPWVVERGVHNHGEATSTIDLVPPPDVTRLLPGDFVEATLVHVVLPQYADDYYGPNAPLRAALREHADTWRMVMREAVGNHREVEVLRGTLLGAWPAVRIRADRDGAAFSITGGLGYVPVTISGLLGYPAPRLEQLDDDGVWQPVDQSVHGHDFWQTDFDSCTGSREITYSLPADTADERRRTRHYRFRLTGSY